MSAGCIQIYRTKQTWCRATDRIVAAAATVSLVMVVGRRTRGDVHRIMSRSYWRGPLAVEVRNGAVVSQELGSWTSVIGVNDERERALCIWMAVG